MKKLIYIITLLFLLSSCNNENDIIGNNIYVGDNCLHLSLSIPEFEIIKTRDSSDDGKINELDIFLFDNAGTMRHIYLTSDQLQSTSNNIDITLSLKNESEINGENRYLDVVANAHSQFTASELVDGGMSRLELRNKIVFHDNETYDTSHLIMYGYTQLLTNDVAVTLKRLEAKITVEVGPEVEDFVLDGFTLENSASGAYLSGIDASGNGNTTSSGSENFYVDNPLCISSKSLHELKGLYVFPTKGVSPDDDVEEKWKKAFIILEGKYKGEVSYYRIDLINENNIGLDLEANKWYQVEIVRVGHKGFPTAEEAAENPETTDFDYLIHDHVADVYSMITDGIRELGAKEIIYISAGMNEISFTVKCYSRNDENKLASESREIDIKPTVTIENSNWLTVDTGMELTSSTQSGTINTDDVDNPGRLWKFTIQKTKDVYAGTTVLLEVSWQGLKREIKIVYDADFNIKSSNTTLLEIIKEDGTIVKLNNYWYILPGDGKVDKESMPDRFIDNDALPRLFGIKSSDLADGKIRTEGFHFPMPYGKNSNWKYRYTINFAWDSYMESGFKNLTEVKVEINGSYFKKHLSYTINEGEVVLEWNGSNDYEYETGSIIFSVSYGNGEETIIPVSLYHTGFFHYDPASSPDKVNAGYYYYEVVKMGNNYWLDRNIGAKSNKMYASYSYTSVGLGDPKAAGRLYKIGSPGDYQSSDIDGAEPIISDDMCPPGYHIPSATEWDDIRLSGNFSGERVSEEGTSYLSTYYLSDKAGKIYFPKSRFYTKVPGSTDGDALYMNPEYANSGTDATGYYWSRSTAYGMEKDEIGKWLRALMIEGSSNTFVSSNIEEHKMNVRCVAGQPLLGQESKYSINFNVKGATHVYLYTEDVEGNKTGIFHFPGKEIGSGGNVDNLDYSDDNSYLTFKYNCTLPASQLKVIFVYISGDSTIKILSKNGSQTLSEADGWDVNVGANYFFISAGSSEMDSRGIFKNTGTSLADCFFKEGKTVTLYWPKWIDGSDMWRIYMFYQDGMLHTAEFPGDDKTDYINNYEPFGGVETYCYKFNLKEDCDEFTVILNTNLSGVGNQTPDIPVNSSSGYSDITIDSNGNYNILLKNLRKL